METISTVASVAMYSFMGLQVDAKRVALAGYGEVDWLSFALVGVATANYLWMCISRLSHSLQHEIREGTLEPIVASLIKMRSYIIGQSIRGFLISGYFMLGVMFVGFKGSVSNQFWNYSVIFGRNIADGFELCGHKYDGGWPNTRIQEGGSAYIFVCKFNGVFRRSSISAEIS